MESFNEYLGNLLAHCRDNALEEVRTGSRYIEEKQKSIGLRSKLEALISPEAKEILDDLFEVMVTLQVMEYNKVLLCGLTMPAELQKRFDASTAEYKAFEEEYLYK